MVTGPSPNSWRNAAPVENLGVDPSEVQLSFACSRHTANAARFQQGDAMALPCEDQSFDAAVMALVLFFVPDPAQGVAEMRRVVRPGGMICAYLWDVLEPGGFPLDPVEDELCAIGAKPVLPPRLEVSRMDALRALWTDAGLTDIATREITRACTFKAFEDFWASAQVGLAMAQATHKVSAETIARFGYRLRTRLPADGSGRITYTSRANAITGNAPA